MHIGDHYDRIVGDRWLDDAHKREEAPLRVLLKCLQAIFYSTNALLIPYMPLLLKSHGFSPLETGSLLAIGPFIAIFAQPLAGMISDKIGAIRPIYDDVDYCWRSVRCVGWGACVDLDFRAYLGWGIRDFPDHA